MLSSMIVSNPTALTSTRIRIEQSDTACCDGINHLYIPACELEIAVCKPSRTYIAQAHMCPCGAVSTDRGKTWEQPHWAVMPGIIREDTPATVTHVDMSPESTIAPTNMVAQKRFKLAGLTSIVMFAGGLALGLALNILLMGILATIASPHVWVWTKVRAPRWWETIVSLLLATPGFLALLALHAIVSADLMLGRMALCLKFWLTALPGRLYTLVTEVLLYAFLMSFFIILVVGGTAVDIWNNRPRVLKANLQGYAFALLVIVTMLAAGIR